MTRDLSDLEHLLDAAEVLRKIQARRPAIALFQSETALSASGREAVFRGRYDGTPAVLTLYYGEGHAERARTQKREIERLETALAEGPYRVAPLVAAWPGEGITVTADVAGETLAEALATADHAARDALLAEAGEWLARLAARAHRQVAFGGRHWMRRTARALERVGGTADRALARSLGTRLEALLPTVAGKPVTQAHGHGDFRPANLVRNGGALYGVGVQTLQWMPVVRDLARFLVALQVACPRAGGAQRFGIGAADLEVLIGPLALVGPRERALHLPFFIGLELAENLAAGEVTAAQGDRLRDAIAQFLDRNGTPLL